MVATKEILQLQVKIVKVHPEKNGVIKFVAMTEDGVRFNCEISAQVASAFEWGEGEFEMGFDKGEVEKYNLHRYLPN